MSQSTSVACRVDEETEARIEQFQQKCNFDKRSQAVEELIKTGLREQKIPVLYRWQKNAIQASHYLMVAAIVLAVIGFSPAAFDWATGAWMGGALVLVGLAIVSVVEAARTVRASNQLGDSILQRGDNA